MAYTTIDDPTIYFNTKLYTGNGGTNNITGLDFQPDWVWIKRRTAADHKFTDSVRGTTKVLECNSTAAESTDSNGLTAFNSDGFTLGSSASFNSNTVGFASWNWKAGGSSTSTNSDGDISGTQTVNQTAGFSITTYSGNGGSNQSLGHGLGATPKVYICKRRDNSGQWLFMNTLTDGTLDYLFLETNGAKSNSSQTLPTSSLVYLQNGGDANESGGTHVCYAFAEKKGYSKFSNFVGNGSTDGVFCFCGFQPSWVMWKKTSSTANWAIRDNKRDPHNPSDNNLFANLSDAESSSNDIDFLSNGFKLRTAGSNWNTSGETYIFMAFAESPFVSSTGIPTTAR